MKLELCENIAGLETVMATGTIQDNGWGCIDTADVSPGKVANRLYVINGERQPIEPQPETAGGYAIQRADGSLEWEIITNGGKINIAPEVIGG